VKASVLALVFGVLYFVGLSHPALVDYDEAGYAVVSKGMHETGNYLEPVLNGETFFEKPPFLYWMQCVSYSIFGVNTVAARAPTALSALLLVVVLYLGTRKELGEPAAVVSGLVLATSLLFVGLARVSFVDMPLTLWFVATLLLFHRALERDLESKGRGLLPFLGACACAGLATLTKGAIGILFPVGAALVHLILLRRFSILLRPLWLAGGLVTMLGVGFSWYLLLGLTRPEGFSFLKELFLVHHVGRFTEPMQGHGGSVLFYVPVVFLGLLPWSLLLLPAVDRATLVDTHSSRARLLRLFGIFSVIAFLFFSASATKLPNYALPVFPGAALWIGDLLGGERASAALRSRRARAALASTVVILSSLAALMVASHFAVGSLSGLPERAVREQPGLEYPIRLGAGPWLMAVAFVLGAAGLWVGFRRGNVGAMVVALAASFFGAELACVVFLAPRFERHFQQPLLRLAKEASTRLSPDERILMLGLRHRASVIFEAGRNTEYCTYRIKVLNEALAADRPRIGLTTQHFFEQFKESNGLERLASDRGYVLFRGGPSRACEVDR